MDSKRNFVNKRNRRSVLNSARRNLTDIDETNNYQLADALAKTRVELSKVHQDKFLYVSQNLKFMDTITQLKDENRKLIVRLAERDNELLKLRTKVRKHENSVKHMNKSLEVVSSTVNGLIASSSNSTKPCSPPSLGSSFDSGLNTSSLNSSTEPPLSTPDIENAPLVAKQEPLFPPPASIPDDLLPETFSPVTSPRSEKEIAETPRIPKSELSLTKRQKRKLSEQNIDDTFIEPAEKEDLLLPVLETPQIVSKKSAFTNRRETPSRSAKAAVKSMVEPRLGGKLRQGDPFTDSFFLEYISRPKTATK